MSAYIRIPLRHKDGSVGAWALVDAEDADLAKLRWHRDYKGYARRRDYSTKPPRNLKLHRVILGLLHGDPREVDHINRDRLDNRRANLRIADDRANSENRSPGGQRGHSSQYRGVSWAANQSRWRADGTVNGRSKNLGYFDSELGAAHVAAAHRETHMTHTTENLRTQSVRKSTGEIHD